MIIDFHTHMVPGQDSREHDTLSGRYMSNKPAYKRNL